MLPTVRLPAERGIAKWVYCHSFQDVCPWNQRFARELPDDSPDAPRERAHVLGAQRLAREQYGVRALGQIEEVRETLHAITAERKVKHPAVVLLTETAQTGLFS